MVDNIFTHSPLAKAELDIQISLPVVTTRLKQVFFNDTNSVIEACYQFPVPRTAVLGNVDVTINEEHYLGKVLEQNRAEQVYEEGIADGKRSVLLRDAGDGLYELNVGNLAIKEKAEISITIHQLANIEKGCLKYFLPTVIAPRYGQRSQTRFDVPKINALAHYPFQAKVTLPDDTKVIASSHSISLSNDGEMEFNGTLNQDIGFTLKTKTHSSVLYSAPFGDKRATLGMMVPELNVSPDNSTARSIQLLVDCSGSMRGVSIQHTKEGLEEAVSSLADTQEVNLIRYGTCVEPLYDKPRALSTELINAVEQLEADLGGTEIFSVLRVAIDQLSNNEMAGDIILITDGKAWEREVQEKIIATARLMGTRIFCVGVGFAISESILHKLSSETGGVLTLVHPHENMADALARVFQRTCQKSLPCEIPVEALKLSTEYVCCPNTMFSHTGNPIAILSDEPLSELSLYLSEQELKTEVTEAEKQNHTRIYQLVVKLLVDMWGQDRQSEATKLATEANIVCRYTSFAMVSDESVEGADGMPVLAEVPQMMHKVQRCGERLLFSASRQPVERDSGYLDVPAFLRRRADPEPTPNTQELDILVEHNVFPADVSEIERIKLVEQRLDRKSTDPKPPKETLNYRFLTKIGFSIEEIKSFKMGTELATCALFILSKAAELQIELSLRVETLLQKNVRGTKSN